MSDDKRPPTSGENSGHRPLDESSSVSDADRAEAHSELKELKSRWRSSLIEFDAKSAGGLIEQRNLFHDALRRFLENKLAVVAATILIVLILGSIFIPMIFNGDNRSDIVNYSQAHQPISWDHPFGTDRFGRDLFMRVWLGGRVSLSVAGGVSLAILIIGVAFGSIAGYAGGRVDNIMMRILDSLYGLPSLPFAIICILVVRSKYPDLGPLWYMVPALSITAWFTSARIVRGQVLSIKQNEFVVAARVAGGKARRIIAKHLIPNTLGILVISAFLEVPTAILGEAFLSFLGLGVPIEPGSVSWGTLASEGAAAYGTNNHLLWGPTLAIALTVTSALAVADGLRDALDPRGRQN